MKQWVVIALAALLVVSGCGTTGGSNSGSGNDLSQEDTFWFLSREEGGIKARNNQVALKKGDSYLYIYFKGDMPGSDFDTIQINFTCDKEIDVTWQAAYDSGNVWGSTEYIGKMAQGPIETDLGSFTQQWYGDGKSVTKSELRGICLMVNDPDGKGVFTLTDVQFTGLVEEEE